MKKSFEFLKYAHLLLYH